MNVKLFAVLPLARDSLYDRSPCWWKRVECCRALNVHNPSVRQYCSKAFVNVRPATEVVRVATTLKVLQLVLDRFLHALSEVSL